MPNTKPLRKTKIIATIGPASDSSEILKQMIEAGMNVARLNMSFGVDDVQQQRLDRIRRIAKEKNVSNRMAALMLGIGRVAECAQIRGLRP